MTPSGKSNVGILPDSVGQSNRTGRRRRLPKRRISAKKKAAKSTQTLPPPPNGYPLQYYKGVGPARAELLARLGIVHPMDLIHTFPRDWEDRRLLHTIRTAPMGEKVALKGLIRNVQFSTLRENLGMASVALDDGTGVIPTVWFKRTNPRYDVFSGLRQQLQVGRAVLVYGSIEWGPPGKQLRVEDTAFCPQADFKISEDDRIHFDRFVPAYTVPEGLPERFLRSLIARVLPSAASVPSIIPTPVRQKEDLADRSWALQRIHFPDSLLEKEKARQVLAFEEFLMLEMALGLLRRQVKTKPKTHRYELKRHLLTPFRESLGFEFTGAQKRVIREIFADMMLPTPMNRLLQGDVGSGKTLVALSAMLLAVENGGQAALMAPTEILAEQHAITLARVLQKLPVRLALVTGRQGPAQRRKCLEEIAAGNVDIAIGTHALIQKDVTFARMTLAVVDEQHRFGVEHRSLLREKGKQTDVLVMTATPIPRTLALTLYGDLDVSTLDELPPGRTPIHTLHVGEDEAWQRIQQAVAQGRQAYVVYPLIEESDKVELKAAVQEAQTLSQTVFRNLRVGVLHGQLPPKDKDQIMEQFRKRELDVLIATSVIEVGIDVPNATVMAIQHAERFGLSTLHQLRGRVGRGAHASSCLLIAKIGNDDARRRIQVMTETTDGFRISEEDLRLRGPGEVMGVMQHGLPPFRLGDILQDAPLIQRARSAAEQVLGKDPTLALPENVELRKAVLTTYAERWPLGLTA